jgi:hypothetical protein
MYIFIVHILFCIVYCIQYSIHVFIYCTTYHEKQKYVKTTDSYYIFINSILSYREFFYFCIFVLSEYGN